MRSRAEEAAGVQAEAAVGFGHLSQRLGRPSGAGAGGMGPGSCMSFSGDGCCLEVCGRRGPVSELCVGRR